MPGQRQALLSAAIRHLARAAALCAALACGAAASAERLAPADVPEPLRPWIGWALGENPDALCPTLDARGFACKWPGRLSLDLGAGGGTFVLRVFADRSESFELPGGGEMWPEEVTLDGRAVAVVGSHDTGQPPSIEVPAGAHEIRGRFVWAHRPPVLVVPEAIGVVALRLDGAAVELPTRDGRGRLWLSAGGEAALEGERRLEIEVHRKVTDEVPLLLETRLVLSIGGSGREERIGPALPPGFVPLSLESPLPVRFDADGRLRVQARPGRFEVTFGARHEGPVSELRAPVVAAGDSWPSEEIWVFESRPTLRLVSVEGAVVDPQQTTLPEEWKALPAYRVAADASVRLVERRRGDAEPAPDELTLERRWFLDFDGGGATVSDHLSGRVHARSRLEMGAGTELGRAAVDGREQFLTRLAGGEKAGLQLSPGNLTIAADSRVPGTARRLPAVGWDHDVASLHGTLQLPPGYELFHASGVDRAQSTWINRWTLLDLFVVGIVTVAFLRLYGFAIGALALAALVLTTTEAGAPRWVWVAVLSAEALRRVVPEGRLQRALVAARLAALAALLVVGVPFVVTVLRVGLHPSLGEPDYVAERTAAVQDAAPMEAAEDEARREQLRSLGYGAGKSAPTSQSFSASPPMPAPREKDLDKVDPSVRITTGPGVPTWSWRLVDLQWSGPVPRDQVLSLWLIPPWGNTLAAIVRAILLGILAAIVLGLRWPRFTLTPFGTTAAAILLALAVPDAARAADFPSDEMLTQLRDRLTDPPECVPRCVDVTLMRLDATASQLRLSLDVSAAAATALALPGSAMTWLPAVVRIDGAESHALLRGEGGTLYLRIPEGAHRVDLEGPLAPVPSIALPLPLVPHRTEARLSGFTLVGLRPDGGVEGGLQLVRDAPIAGEDAGVPEAPALPPFLRVHRRFDLGLTWDGVTQVVRLSPAEAALVIELPLLAGESVTTPGIEVRDGRARIALPPGTANASFRSVLATGAEIALRAPEGVPWTEWWEIRASPIWHLAASGIPPVQPDAARPFGPDLEWHPWPGESVAIRVDRPDGVAGATLTVDAAELTLLPGVRSSDDRVLLRVRSSQGGEHRVTLPEGATLQRVAIDGTEQPLRQEGRAVIVPIRPGSSAVEIGWRAASGISAFWRGPELDLGAPAVNVDVTVQPSVGRWILWLSGPPLGPAVLFWPVLLAYLGIAWALGWTRIAPLRTWQWALLALGLTQVGVLGAGAVALWLLALGWRAEHGTRVPGRWFDLVQIALVALTVAAFVALAEAIYAGLLGQPDMQIAGYRSNAEYLRWYQDRSEAVLPRPRILSVPLGVYRGLMLVWSFWIAAALIGWLRFAWRAFSAGELWRPLRKPRAAAGESSP